MPGAGYGGIDELTAEIGATAVDLLTGLIQRGEKGVPAIATTTQLMGRWVRGHSCPRRAEVAAPAPAAGSGATRMIFFSE